MNTIKSLQYEAVFMPQLEGGYTVEVPDLPGCISEGETLEEAKDNIQEAIDVYIETFSLSSRTPHWFSKLLGARNTRNLISASE